MGISRYVYGYGVIIHKTKKVEYSCKPINEGKNSALDTQELKALEDVISSVVALKQENKSLSEKLALTKNDLNQAVMAVNVENADQLKAEIGNLKLQLANEKKGNETYRKKLESLNALLGK